MTYKKDQRKGPPPGWKVENVLYQKLLVSAKRSQSQSLLKQVEVLRNAPRSELAKIVDVVARAVKGDLVPESLDLQLIIDNGGDLSCLTNPQKGEETIMETIVEPAGAAEVSCDICGGDDQTCICPECRVCGATGDLKCITKHMALSCWAESFKQLFGVTELEMNYKQVAERQEELEKLIATLSSGVVDVHFRTQSQVYIVSKLGDGYFTHIDTNFKSYPDLIEFVKRVKAQFGNPKTLWDVPGPDRAPLKEMRKVMKES